MRIFFLAPLLALASPLAAQDHGGHDPHKGHGSLPAEDARKPAVDHCAMGHLPPEQCPPKDTAKTQEPDPHAGHGGKDHGQMDHGQMNHGAHGGHGAHGATPAEDDAPPARAFDGPLHAADAIWGEDAMAPSRAQLAKENGGMTTGVVLIERLEARVADDEDGFVWDAQAWYGGDINRFFLKTEGEGELGGDVEDAEVQFLFSHAIGPFFDLQAGARVDVEPETRSHLVLGVQGLAPYWFHVDGALFLSDRGDLTARFEGEYDQKITQALIVQPRVELELAAQDIPERDVGAGLTKVEAGVRLRYEIIREFAPYIGVEYEAKLGETANIARAAGEETEGFVLLAGIRAWF